MIKYIEDTPIGKAHLLLEMDGLVQYYTIRQNLKLSMIERIFESDVLVVNQANAMEKMKQWM